MSFILTIFYFRLDFCSSLARFVYFFSSSTRFVYFFWSSAEHTMSHHHTYYVTSSYILCHIIIHTMSHYHTSLSTSFGHRQNPSPPHRRAEQANIHRHIIIHTMCTTISHHHTYYVTSSGPLGCPQTHRARKQQQGPATAGRRECREECILLLLLQGASHEPFLPCQKGRGQAGAHRVAHTGYHQYRRRGRGCARGWRPCQAHPHKTQYRRTTSAT